MKKRRATSNSFRRTGRYLLDKFSQSDLRTWKKFSDGVDEYNVRLYYHLESLREIHAEELTGALNGFGSRKRVGKAWFRLVDFKYSNEFLSTKGSIKRGGRFNIGADLDARRFPSFPALYIAADFDTAYSEYFGAPMSASAGKFPGHEFALVDQGSFTAVKLSFELKNLFDLSKTSSLDAFSKIISKFKMPDDLKTLGRSIGLKQPWLLANSGQLRKSLLDSNWRNFPVQHEIPSNPQVFGRLLRNAGMEGVVYPSTKGKSICIAIFTENLDGSGSFVELADEAPPGILHTKLHSDNWEDLSSFD